MSFFSDYKRSLKLVEVEEIPDLCLYRPLAYLLVKAIFRTPITPNQVTIFSIFVGVAAGVGFGLGTVKTVKTAALLYAFSVVLDCADGQLARLKKNGTRMGRVLDGLIDYITGFSAYLGIAIGLKPENWPADRWWPLIIAAAASTIFHSITLDYYRTRFLNILKGFSESEDEDYRGFKTELAALRAARRRPIRQVAIASYLGYLEIQKRMTIRWQPDSPLRRVGVEEFVATNKKILRLWTYLGSSTQITLLIGAVLLDRIGLYFWAMIVILNIYAAVLYIVQSRIDIRLERKTGP